MRRALQNAMLGAYRLKLWIALSFGAALAFVLGWLVSQRGLRPVRQLAARAAAIDVQHLHLRLDEFRALSELSTLSQALNQMLSRLEAGFAQLSRFSEDLAHEMRTPLSNLMGQTQQALGRVRSAEEYQNLLASNQEEYERLARMIDSMLSNSGVLFSAPTTRPFSTIMVIGVAGRLTWKVVSPKTNTLARPLTASRSRASVNTSPIGNRPPTFFIAL